MGLWFRVERGRGRAIIRMDKSMPNFFNIIRYYEILWERFSAQKKAFFSNFFLVLREPKTQKGGVIKGLKIKTYCFYDKWTTFFLSSWIFHGSNPKENRNSGIPPYSDPFTLIGPLGPSHRGKYILFFGLVHWFSLYNLQRSGAVKGSKYGGG